MFHYQNLTSQQNAFYGITHEQRAISNSNASFKCNLMFVYNQPDIDFLTKN